MNEHPSFLVYRHLPQFFESRGLEAPAGKLDLEQDVFTAELDHTGYFRLDATRGERVTVVLLLAQQGRYVEQGPALRGLIAALNVDKFARDGHLEEVIVIASEDVLQKKKNMTDVVAAFREAAGTEAARAAHYNMYADFVFSLDVPRAREIPRHLVVAPGDVDHVLARERVDLTDLRRIPATNPPVVWLGARPGQVVRIDRDSETAGEACEYCLVIP